MTQEEFNLSEKIEECADACFPAHVITASDVKEFIEKLREEIGNVDLYEYFDSEIRRQEARSFIGKIGEIISALAGDKLK